jgi:hypothetical protein
MGAGTVIFEGIRRKPKRNRGPQEARSIADISNNGGVEKDDMHDRT